MKWSMNAIEDEIDRNDDLYYWAKSWTRDNRKPVSFFIRKFKEDIIQCINRKEDKNKGEEIEMNFILMPGKCRCFNSIPKLIENEFGVKFNEVKWTIINNEDGSTVKVRHGNEEKTLFGFKSGNGFVDLVESGYFPVKNFK